VSIAPVEARLDIAEAQDIDAKHAAMGGASGVLGAPTGPEQAAGPGRVRRYAKGAIYWSPRWEAQALLGPILARYDQLGGPAGPLGFPRSDVANGRAPASKVAYFDNGAIYWSEKTGAREVLGAIYVRYQDLEAEAGFVGLPTTFPATKAGGSEQAFANATLYAAPGADAFEVHGAIRERYVALGGPAGILGFPLSNETDVLAKGGAVIGKASRFLGGTIFWSGRTGAFEVHGGIGLLYEQLGGPAGSLGFPLTNETRITTASGETRFNDFERGIIVWRSHLGARAITKLAFHIGQVTSGSIDDGIEFLGKDRTAELITFTTIEINGTALETRVRRPGGHAGSSHDINRRFTADTIRHDSRIRIKVDVDDWDQATGNDFLGTLDRTFDIDTWWGLLGGSPAGVYNDLPATKKGGDAPSLSTLKFDLGVGDQTGLDPSRPYREQHFWRFDNFKTETLTREQYAATFRDVDHAESTWDKIRNPFDTAYYELAYKSVAANGNCFGHSLESLYALADRSVFIAPLHQHAGTAADAADANPQNILAGPKAIINEKHGYQLGASAIRSVIGQLTNLDAIRPMQVFANVEQLLMRRNWPVLSMVDMGRGSGHAVVPYRTERRPDKTCRIYVADPNVVWRETQGDPTYVEIRPDDTFTYVGGTSTFQSTKILDGHLPGTLLLAIPFSELSSMPRTPYWEVLLALGALTGMVLIIAGDAQASALGVDGKAFYDTANGQRRIKPGAAGQMARIPLLDAPAGPLPELYVRRGHAHTVELELAAKGAGAGKAQLLTHDVHAELESPAGRSADRMKVSGLGTRAPQAAVQNAKDKEAKVRLSRFKDRVPSSKRGPRDGLNVVADLPLTAGRELTLGFDAGGGAVLHGLRAGQRSRVELTSQLAGRVSKAAFDLEAEASDDALRVVVADPSNLRDGLEIQRLSGPGGSIISTHTPEID
jgi:hypothetical protein